MDTSSFLTPLGEIVFQEHAHGDGSISRHDSMGRLLARYTPDVGGNGGTWSDPLGRVLERVHEFGGVSQHFDPVGTLKFTTHQDVGGQFIQQDPLGQTLLRHDPMTGSITNAIGQLVARKV